MVDVGLRNSVANISIEEKVDCAELRLAQRVRDKSDAFPGWKSKFLHDCL